MAYYNKDITMEDMNEDIYLAMANSLRFPLNEIVAWAIFGDSTFIDESDLLYSNYADLSLDNNIINSEHLDLMNDIEQDIKKYIDENALNVDFSTIDSATKSIEGILTRFLLVKNKELTSLHQKNSVFKGFSIWWGALVIAYREMAIFAYKNGKYYVAMQLSEFCKECQSQMMFKNVAFIKAYQKKLSARNKIGGNAKWKNTVEKQRRRYLELDHQYQKETGVKLSIQDMAVLIYNNNDNEFNVTFETIQGHLSKARKGVFTNNRK